MNFDVWNFELGDRSFTNQHMVVCPLDVRCFSSVQPQPLESSELSELSNMFEISNVSELSVIIENSELSEDRGDTGTRLARGRRC